MKIWVCIRGWISHSFPRLKSLLLSMVPFVTMGSKASINGERSKSNETFQTWCGNHVVWVTRVLSERLTSKPLKRNSHTKAQRFMFVALSRILPLFNVSLVGQVSLILSISPLPFRCPITVLMIQSSKPVPLWIGLTGMPSNACHDM